jgi:hypothetical protein
MRPGKAGRRLGFCSHNCFSFCYFPRFYNRSSKVIALLPGQKWFNRIQNIVNISVGIAIFSTPVQTGPEAHPASYTMGTGSFPGVKRPGRGVVHPPHLAPRLKSTAIPLLLLLWAFVACSRVTFTFTLKFFSACWVVALTLLY